jgi:Ca-activated chloride channel family protein
MQRLWLTGYILPVGARLFVHHTFRSAETQPLEVIYSFGLPRDAALRRFRITGEGLSVKSGLKPVGEATKIYEEGIDRGRLSTIIRQYQDGIVNLTVGNIRSGEEVKVNIEVIAGVEIHDDGLRFRFPFALAPGYHSQARVSEVKPGTGEIELPEDEFGDLFLPQFVSDASTLHEVGFDLDIQMADTIVECASPSHPLRFTGTEPDCRRISLATTDDVPNRDVVIDVRTEGTSPGTLTGTSRDGRGRFVSIIPSTQFGTKPVASRRIAFVLDRSGSMAGAPIEQARRALRACLGALADRDVFGIVAFDNSIEFFQKDLVYANRENRAEAKTFLNGIDARGGTELASAVEATARFFNEGGGDIIVLTDGQVFGTDPILARARSMGVRIHCLGIGSAGRDRFLSQLAEQTGGTFRSVTSRERVDLSSVDLFSAAGNPVATDLSTRIDGFPENAIAPEPHRLVYEGCPLVLYGETSAPGEGRLHLEWISGDREQNLDTPLSIGRNRFGETLRLLQGSRLISYLEGRYGIVAGDRMEERHRKRIDERLMELSQKYGLMCRLTALVAVVEREGDRQGDLPVTRIVPVGLPEDVEFGAYFGPQHRKDVSYQLNSIVFQAENIFTSPDRISMRRSPAKDTMFAAMPKTPSTYEGEDDGFLTLAARIESDGGLPGDSDEERTLATILALLQFLADGHTTRRGIFRHHVRRLLEFLEKSPVQNDTVRAVIARIRSGKALEGDWSNRSPVPSLWKELDKLLNKKVKGAN